MAFNLGAGLSLMGRSIAQSAQAYSLERQRGMLDTQRVALGEALAEARESRRDAATMAREDARDTAAATRLEARDARQYEQQKSLKQMEIDADKAKTRPSGETNIAKLRADLNAGRITQKEYDAGFRKETYVNEGNDRNPIEVGDGKGGTTFVNPRDAIGKPGKPTAPRQETIPARMLALIDKKYAGTATPADLNQLEELKKTSAMDQILLDLFRARDQGSGASPTPAPGGRDIFAPDGASPGKPAAPKAAQPQAKKPMPLPPDLASEPDGTIVEDDSGTRYVKRGSSLVPQ